MSRESLKREIEKWHVDEAPYGYAGSKRMWTWVAVRGPLLIVAGLVVVAMLSLVAVLIGRVVGG